MEQNSIYCPDVTLRSAYNLLFEKGVISADEFEDVSKTFNVSKEQYEYSKNQLYLLVEGYIPSSNVSNVVTATAELVLTEKKDILFVPESCLTFRNDSVFVDVVKHGKPESRQIEIGISDNINIEITGGINEDDKILKKKSPLTD